LEQFEDIGDLRNWVSGSKRSGKTVVFVPTMGALHEGHSACVRTGRAVMDSALVVSIYVNPTQFAPGEDLDRYPRSPDRDLALCRQWGVDAVFTPRQRDIYPENRPGPVWVAVENLTDPMCGAGRPGHFRGVATVVTKLFNIVSPDVAVFGQKDAQQALVIREVVKQLFLPVELRLAPINREPDGLARSSRNRYLNEEQRRVAVSLYSSLRHALDFVRSGERDPEKVTAAVAAELAAGDGVAVEYVELRNAGDLSALETVEGKAILAVAATVGTTRLIDNVVFRVDKNESVEETLLF
jgi:pantoate--beta-alanine ligase